MVREFRSMLGTFWCIHNHLSVMWPVHGQYQCRTCGRRYMAFAEAPLANSTERLRFEGCCADSLRTSKPVNTAIVPACAGPILNECAILEES